ncbi:AraC-like DNA-binding protein [Albidovulum inexpectatum]|uniref:AraC-like DNA-binding protein n=2 Tax=Albidovulum inexpectatum TaxID=196587 RepID=A0A2S5JF35_9RHOB|nr:AraC-like DNA-binding protein [Albidovulum inexpectatum]
MRALAEPMLLWFTRGQGRITISGLRRGYGVHNAIHVPAGVMHCVEIGPQTFGSAVFFGYEPNLALPRAPLHLRVRDVAAQAALSSLIENAQRELASAAPLSRQAAWHHLGLIGIWLMRHENLAQESPGPDAAQRLVTRYTDLIECTLGSGKGVAELAAELGVTPTHLTRACQKCCGRSAMALLQDRLMFEARLLLAETRLPVAEIARRLGYGSAGYFTRAFERQTGQTPSAFRKVNRRDPVTDATKSG